MRSEISGLVKKAKESFEAAKKLFADGYFDFSVSRAYYAMFYMTEAILLTKDLSFSKHSGVISAFGEHFVKPGIIHKKYHQSLRDAFRARNIGDYAHTEEITKEEADSILVSAEDFLKEIEDYLKKKAGIFTI